MNIFLILAFLFFIGSLGGWVLELFYRRFFSTKKWINPGFCTGPYIPLYGFGLCLLYLIAGLEKLNIFPNLVMGKIVLFAVMALCMTGIEYLAGIMCLRYFNLRLWDYSREWGNVDGLICPKFSLIWAVCGAIYYFAVHPHILGALYWLSENLAFSFFIGLFFGFFTVDVVHSAQLVAKMRAFAEENDVIIRFEHVKAHIHTRNMELRSRTHFFRAFRSEVPLHVHMAELRESFEKRKKK